jgi:hypothetical protein
MWLISDFEAAAFVAIVALMVALALIVAWAVASMPRGDRVPEGAPRGVLACMPAGDGKPALAQRARRTVMGVNIDDQRGPCLRARLAPHDVEHEPAIGETVEGFNGCHGVWFSKALRLTRQRSGPSPSTQSAVEIGQSGLDGAAGLVGARRGAVRDQCAVIGLAAGNLTGTCGEVLTTRGAPSAWLFSVSISRMNFSASMGVASLIRLGAEQLRPPRGRSGGRYACLPQIGGSSADEALLPEHQIRVLLLRANDLCSGASRVRPRRGPAIGFEVVASVEAAIAVLVAWSVAWLWRSRTCYRTPARPVDN